MIIKIWSGQDCPYKIIERNESDPIIEFVERKNETKTRKGIIKKLNTLGEYVVEVIE